MKLNIPLWFMWSAITVMGLYSRHMNPDILVYMFVAAIVVSIVK